MHPKNQPPIWQCLYIDPGLKTTIRRGLIYDIHALNFYKGPRQLLVVVDPVLAQKAVSEPHNEVLEALGEVPAGGPGDEQLRSIGLEFLDPTTIPDDTIRAAWTAECKALEDGIELKKGEGIDSLPDKGRGKEERRRRGVERG